MTDHVILADDLSGAAESASAALLRTTRIQVLLDPTAAASSATGADAPRVVAVDLDTRRADATGVTGAVAGARDLLGTGALLVLKVDSVLRGRPDLLVTAVRAELEGTGAPVLAVVATATPSLGRTVVGGAVHVDGTPLPRTGLWRAEATAPPASVAEAVGSPEAPVVPLVVVRGPRTGLVEALARAVPGGVVVCDAEDDADLDAVVAAASAVPGVRPLLVGAGGLAAAASRSLPADPDTAPTVLPAPGSVLVVVGSAAPLLATEVEDLRAGGGVVVDLPVADLLAGRARLAPPGDGVTVVRPEPSSVDPAVSADLVAALARAVTPAAATADALVLTGGETARAVLTALGTRSLAPLAATGGTVTSRADDGRLVVTRPGSFGGAHRLAAIVSSLTPRAPKEPT